jgi:hypothetical protein
MFLKALVAPRRQVWAQDELVFETAHFEMAVCLGDLIGGDPLGDAGSDGACYQKAEDSLQVVTEPSRIRATSRARRR